MTRTPLSGLAIAAILAMATGSLLQNTEASAAEKKGKGTNARLLGWATFPSYGNQPRTRLRNTAGESKRKGSGSTYLRMGQPPAGGLSTRGSVPRRKLTSDGESAGGKAGRASDFNSLRRQVNEGLIEWINSK